MKASIILNELRNGCPHCVSFKINPLGEVKDEYKSKIDEIWK